MILRHTPGLLPQEDKTVQNPLCPLQIYWSSMTSYKKTYNRLLTLYSFSWLMKIQILTRPLNVSNVRVRSCFSLELTGFYCDRKTHKQVSLGNPTPKFHAVVPDLKIAVYCSLCSNDNFKRLAFSDTIFSNQSPMSHGIKEKK